MGSQQERDPALDEALVHSVARSLRLFRAIDRVPECGPYVGEGEGLQSAFVFQCAATELLIGGEYEKLEARPTAEVLRGYSRHLRRKLWSTFPVELRGEVAREYRRTRSTAAEVRVLCRGHPRFQSGLHDYDVPDSRSERADSRPGPEAMTLAAWLRRNRATWLRTMACLHGLSDAGSKGALVRRLQAALCDDDHLERIVSRNLGDAERNVLALYALQGCFERRTSSERVFGEACVPWSWGALASGRGAMLRHYGFAFRARFGSADVLLTPSELQGRLLRILRAIDRAGVLEMQELYILLQNDPWPDPARPRRATGPSEQSVERAFRWAFEELSRRRSMAELARQFNARTHLDDPQQECWLRELGLVARLDAPSTLDEILADEKERPGPTERRILQALADEPASAYRVKRTRWPEGAWLTDLIRGDTSFVHGRTLSCWEPGWVGIGRAYAVDGIRLWRSAVPSGRQVSAEAVQRCVAEHRRGDEWQDTESFLRRNQPLILSLARRALDGDPG